MHHRPEDASALQRCHNIADLRLLARRRLPRPIFDYLDGGAEEERTARRNTAAFDDWSLLPRALVDVGNVSTATTVLGHAVDWPVMCSPTGASRFCHAEGEMAVARASGEAGIWYGLSTTATYALEEVAAASSGPKLFQLYLFRNRELTAELVDRCKQAGYRALCLTVDAAVPGKRERDLRSGWGVPIRLSPLNRLAFLLYPRWCLQQLRRGRLSMPNLARLSGSENLVAQTRYLGAQLDPTVTWKDVGHLIQQWKGQFAIKGIMCVDDARRAVQAGATAIMVSNHGGRQLDGAAAAFEALPTIARAVGHEVDVILDGGIRRGVHVLKALALGAKACSVGRPYLYGLSAAGESGVAKALQILRTEFIRAMQLSGCADVRRIDPALLTRHASSSAD